MLFLEYETPFAQPLNLWKKVHAMVFRRSSSALPEVYAWVADEQVILMVLSVRNSWPTQSHVTRRWCWNTKTSFRQPRPPASLLRRERARESCSIVKTKGGGGAKKLESRVRVVLKWRAKKSKNEQILVTWSSRLQWFGERGQNAKGPIQSHLICSTPPKAISVKAWPKRSKSGQFRHSNWSKSVL